MSWRFGIRMQFVSRDGLWVGMETIGRCLSKNGQRTQTPLEYSSPKLLHKTAREFIDWRAPISPSDHHLHFKLDFDWLPVLFVKEHHEGDKHTAIYTHYSAFTCKVAHNNYTPCLPLRVLPTHRPPDHPVHWWTILLTAPVDNMPLLLLLLPADLQATFQRCVFPR